ncbi:MAG TPA: ACP S-malonyltransferase [Armatimonadetes bacterium]|nr:ACP S-malonyltransferase [Armatimonadota bacterium]
MSKTAFLFPGQGVQRVGMGRDLYDASPAVREWIDAASKAAGIDLARLCFEGPENELTRTCNAQPAILAASVAALISLREALGQAGTTLPAVAAGLSLGEYTALVCAGALTPTDGVHLVRQRGLFMEEAGTAVGGTMASVLGLDREQVDAICQEVEGLVVGANYNAPGQIVISGETPAVERAGALAKARGARRVLPLNVSGAFHSPLMQPAADRLGEVLNTTPLTDARIPVVANVLGEPVQTASTIRTALLQQMTGSVLWEDTVRRMAADGVTTFVEVGPGRVLSGLVRRIAPEARTLQAGDVASIAATAEELRKA